MSPLDWDMVEILTTAWKKLTSWLMAPHPIFRAIEWLDDASQLLFDFIQKMPEGADKDRLRAVGLKLRAVAEVLKAL